MHYRSSSVFSLGSWATQFPTGLACPAVLRKSVSSRSTFAYRTSTVSGRLFNTFQLVCPLPSTAPTTPANRPVWALPRSLATTSGIISVPLGTEMFQFPRFPPHRLCVHLWVSSQSCDDHWGFPIRTSPDIALAHSSPRLFAVFHVLLRRLTPRHPPYALRSSLHVIRRNCYSTCRYAVGKVLSQLEYCCRPFEVDPREAPSTHWVKTTARPSTLDCECVRPLAAKQPGNVPGCLENQPGLIARTTLLSSGERLRLQVVRCPQTDPRKRTLTAET